MITYYCPGMQQKFRPCVGADDAASCNDFCSKGLQEFSLAFNGLSTPSFTRNSDYKKDKYSKVLFGPLWFYSVNFGHFRSSQSTWSYSIHFSPIQSTLVIFGPFCPLWFTLVLFSPFYPLCFYSVHIVLINPLCPLWSYSVQFGFFCSYLVHYIHFGPNLFIRSYLVNFSPIRSILV